MSASCIRTAITQIACVVVILLCASLSIADRDPYIGVWTFPSKGQKNTPSSSALILDQKAFGFVDDWRDRKHTTPISGVWSIANGVLVMRVQHTEMGEVHENTEMRWKVVINSDTMRVTPDDGSPELVLKRLPAEFDTTVILPDATRYKVNEEFKYEPESERDLLSNGLPKKIIEGTYLGRADMNGRSYYKYQFWGVLKGANRGVNLYLEIPGNAKGKSQHLSGLLQEVQGGEIENARTAILCYHYHPSYDKDQVMSDVTRRGFSAQEMNEYPHYFLGWVWDYEQTFICYPPFDWPKVDYWNCTIEVQRSR
jgi:hypothetical protein